MKLFVVLCLCLSVWAVSAWFGGGVVAADALTPPEETARGIELVQALLVAERRSPEEGEDPFLALRPDQREWARSVLAMSDPQILREARRLVLDLRSDNVRWNAIRASRRLQALGDAAMPALREVLFSQDEQQRLMALSLVMRNNPPLDDELLAAIDHTLDSDGYPAWQIADDSHATRRLIEAGEEAWEEVLPGLHASDPQRRFLSALVLAHTQCPRDRALTVTILCGHLRDNDWVGDAGMASRAIYAMGAEAVPHLERLQTIRGPQARALIQLLLAEFERPSRDQHEAYERALRLAPGPNGKPLVVWRLQEEYGYGLKRRSR